VAPDQEEGLTREDGAGDVQAAVHQQFNRLRGCFHRRRIAGGLPAAISPFPGSRR
jgi:hypothetical protein